MKPRFFFLAVSLLLAVPAWAQNSAEYDRVSKQMEALAKRNAWQGVEREYKNLEALELDVRSRDLILGAQAARNRGDAYNSRERLLAAMKKTTEGGEAFSPELSQWLGDLQTNYGPIHLVAKSQAARLGSKQSFFQPDRREATKYAAETLMESGEFYGLLPIGIYIWGGEVIEIEAGSEMPPRRKLKKVKPKRQYW